MQKVDLQFCFKETQEKYQAFKKKSNIYALMRFLLIVVCVVSLLVGYFQKISFLYFIAFLCLFFFICIVYVHQSIKEKMMNLKALTDVYQEHLLRREGKWTEFHENGENFLKENMYQAYDLDILGQHSLFQMMNIAFTSLGKKQFVSLLTSDSSYQDILSRQEAVKELSQNEEFVYYMEMYGKMMEHKDENQISHFIQGLQTLPKKMPRCIFVVSVVTIMGLIGMLLGIEPYSRVAFEIGVVFQIGFSLLFLIQHQAMFQPVMRFNQSLQSYQKIFAYIEMQEFHSSLLKKYQNEICVQYQAVKGMKQLSQIAQRMSYRQNIFAFIFLNGLCMFDFIVRNQYIAWLQEYQKSVQLWLDDLAHIESLMCLSVLSIDEFDVNIPYIISDKKPALSLMNVRHPLIPPHKVVGNHFQMKQNVCVITGSNMSGKTTFMRTVGLNLVLAYAGGYVFADEMTCSIMHILTSMRIQDNVEEGVSTFYGELLRIKQMIQYGEKQQPMICFIDEIFKGTNSLDRIAGAKATIQRLSKPYMFTFLTTHDVELCHVEGMNFTNYHFEESYQDNRICFDYLMKEGPSRSTNGQFLLKQLGIM